ncbi:hypothetical protein D3C83_314180 [compost metagenome]
MVRGVLSTKEATNTILAYELNKKLEGMLSAAVASGKMVEQEMPEEGMNQMEVVK